MDDTSNLLKHVNYVFSDDILNTLDAFIDCDLNVSETARRLGVHRNTLTYRFEQFERYTGLDPTKFSNVVKIKNWVVVTRSILNCAKNS